MEFHEIVVKDTPGLCRCCLSEGCYKDLSTEYTWMDEQEIYADMLLECFDISISQHMEGPNGPNRLICEVCITRLRDACNFKKQVLDSEKKFVDMVGRGAFKRMEAQAYSEPMKSEAGVELHPLEETEIEYLEDDIIDYDMDGNKEEPEPTVSEDVLVSTLPVKAKRGRPKKTVVKPEKKKTEKKKLRMEDKPKTKTAKGEMLKRTETLRAKNSSLTKVHKKEIEDKTSRSLHVLRKNITKVVQNSTVIPFRWLSSCFRCFYCYAMFEKPQDLKAHQQTHKPDDLERTMRNYCEQILHADVSDITCKLCYGNMDDVFQLIDHLIVLHEIPFDREVGLKLVPIKLDEGSKCFFCSMVFKTFALLLQHMNKFHKNYFRSSCMTCGRQFKSYTDFCQHTKYQILDGHQEKCLECGVYFSYDVLRAHMKDVHGRRYKCLSCFEFFTTHYKRSNHMADVHNRRDRIKCPYCSKTFIFKSIMQRHVRENHLKEKNAVCEVCGWKTFGKHELANHMARHTNVKSIKCPGCDKSFKTSRYMKKHYAKTHEQ